jgi:hypothetical protein
MELVFLIKKYEQSDDQSGYILGLCKGHEKANYSFKMFSTNAFFFIKTLEH